MTSTPTPSPEQQQGTAIARRIDPRSLGLPMKPVSDPALVQDALAFAAARRYNLLAPITKIDFLPPDHVVSIRVVSFDAEFSEPQVKARSNGSWYITDNGYALHRPALDQLLAAAGGSWVAGKCGRVDDGKTLLYWRFRMTLRIKGFDGQEREITRERELDLRDGAAEAAAMQPRQLAKARAMGSQLCESKAANRTIRAALGIKGSYTREEMVKPFVFPVLIWAAPADDPVIRRMVAAKELGLAEAMFGPAADPQRAHALLAPAGSVLDAEVVGAGDELPVRQPAPALPPPPPSEPAAPAREPVREPAHQARPPQAAGTAPTRAAAPAQPSGQTQIPVETDGDWTDPGPVCAECGAEVSVRMADWTQREFRRVLCDAHLPAGR